MISPTTSHASFMMELDGFLTSNGLGLEVTSDEGVELLKKSEIVLNADDLDDFSCTDSVTSSSSSDTKHQSDMKSRRCRKRVIRENKKQEYNGQAQSRAKETKRRREYRERMKTEQNSLQEQVAELTKQVVTLTQRLVKKTSESNAISCVSMWKSIARCQEEEKQQSIQEHKQLIAAVSSQASLIQEVGVFVFNRLKVYPAVDASVIDTRVMDERKDAVLFGTLLAEIDADFARTNAVLGTSGGKTMSAGMTMSTFKNPSDGSVSYFQYRGKKMSSLNFEQVCNNLWSLAHIKHRRQDRVLFDRTNHLANTFGVRYRVVAQLTTGVAVSLLQRTTVRRFVADDHVVLVWRVFVEGEGAYAQMHTNESGWCRLRRGAESGVVIEWCVYQVPMHFGSNPRKVEIEQFHDAVIQISKENEEQLSKGLQLRSELESKVHQSYNIDACSI